MHVRTNDDEIIGAICSNSCPSQAVLNELGARLVYERDSAMHQAVLSRVQAGHHPLPSTYETPGMVQWNQCGGGGSTLIFGSSFKIQDMPWSDILASVSRPQEICEPVQFYFSCAKKLFPWRTDATAISFLTFWKSNLR
jgi:hypothetical protein